MLTLRNKTINFLLDTGASVNLLIGKDFDNMEGITLEKTNIKLYSFEGKTPIKIKGKFEEIITFNGRGIKSEFFVTESSGRNSILSYNTCVELGIIHIVAETTNTKIQD